MKRRVSIVDHDAFLSGLLSDADHDEIDELAADPILERLPAYRSGREVDRLDQIFRELESERGEG